MASSSAVAAGHTSAKRPDKVVARACEGARLEALGLALQDLTPELAEPLNYEDQSGVLVAQVNPSSAAAMAGVRRGTLIREVNRQAVQSTADVIQALAESDKTKRVLLLLQDRRGTRFVALPVG